MHSDEKLILVVDDSRTIRLKIREELEQEGYRVAEAKDGFEALIYAASQRPPDLITLDVEMPKMNGFETCRKFRQAHYARFFTRSADHHVPVVFITSNDTMEDRKKGFEMGAADFITKPFPSGEVCRIVSKILFPRIVPEGICAMVADDNLTSRRVAANCLAREGIEVVEAEDGRQAYDIVKERGSAIDIIITDMVMPQLDGETLCRKIRRELAMPDIPIIFLTGISDLSQLLNVFKAGASDYLVKPFAKEELLARIGVHIERNRINKKLRETIDNLKDANTEIKRLSIVDPLTGCFNRGYLNRHLPKELKRAARYSQALTIALCDIDHFKHINDEYGHQAGDSVLTQFADRIRGSIRRDLDWVARYGGEEFIVVFPETVPANAEIAAEKLRRLTEAEVFLHEEQQIFITASFGIAGFESAQAEPSMEELFKQADQCLYAAKNSGRNRVCRWTDKVQSSKFGVGG